MTLLGQESPASFIRRYVWTFAIVLSAIVLRAVAEPALDHGGFSVFLFAVLVGAWVGGVGPSLLGQTALLIFQVSWYSTPQAHWQPSVRGLTSLAAYYLVGITVAVLSEARQAALRRVEAKQDELKATITAIGDGVVAFDRSGCIRFLNTTAELLSGWRAAAAIGQPVTKVLQLFSKDGESPVDLISQIGHPGVLGDGQIFTLISKNGDRVPVTCNATRIARPKGSPNGAVVVIRNETHRLQAEQLLLDLNRRKDDFLATLAHELRNPLAPIRTGLQLLKLSQGDPNVVTDVQEILERQTHHMIRLIDDLLDVSRITRGKLQLRPSPISFARVVQQAVEAIRPLIDAAGHQLIIDLPEHSQQIEADPDRLMQIACNLLNNAVKFTPAGGRIQVRVEENGQNIQLVVTDNGRGIQAEQLESIFEMFHQGLESQEQGHSGLGIGLTLARRLAELHGGRLDVDSPGVNLGSTFRLTLPFPQHVSMEPAQPSIVNLIRAPHAPSRRILLVDDNRDALTTMQLLVRSLGHDTRCAHDGIEAIEMASEFRPDVILMDLGMPRMSGYDAARRIRQESWGRGVLLVALTGWGQERDRQRTEAAGFDHHFVKPIDLEALQGFLERPGRGRPAVEADVANYSSN